MEPQSFESAPKITFGAGQNCLIALVSFQQDIPVIWDLLGSELTGFLPGGCCTVGATLKA